MPFISNRARTRKLALAAATLAITAAADPVADIPTQLGVSGRVSDYGHFAVVKHKPAGGARCGASPSTDDGDTVALSSSLLGNGAFATQGNVTFDQAGDYLACAWVVRYGLGAPDTVVAARSRIVNVRAPHLGLAITATPTAIVSGQNVHIDITALAEVERALYVYGVSDVGRGCPANAEAAEKTDGSFVIIWKHRILGGPVGVTTDETLERVGTRLLCAYIQREYSSDPAEAVAQATVTIAAPPPPCVVPSVEGRPLAAVSDRIRGAGCTVGAVRYEPSARHARGTVFKIAPLAGATLSPGAAVDLWVSTGAPCVVPALPASRTLGATKQRLVAAGCAAGRVTRRRSASVHRGRVVALGKPRGAKLPPRTRVAIVVSRGAGRRD